jgi:putative IMPACT (imprinted ancient) family translation regulator
MADNLSFDFWWKIPAFKKKIIQNVITDRWSKYTVVGGFISSKEEIKVFVKELSKDKYFRNATHNTYAYRIKQENWSILEWKNDDWETGAGMCVLRELQRENAINIIVVITRYFGWTKLYTDRFKNVIEATKIMLKEI